MEISIIDLPDIEVDNSVNEIKNTLSKDKRKEFRKDRISYLISNILKDLNQDELLENLTNIGKKNIIFIEGNIYNVSFNYPVLYFNNNTVKTIYKKMINICGVAIHDKDLEIKRDKKGGTSIQIEYFNKRYTKFIAKNLDELTGLISYINNTKNYYNIFNPIKYITSDLIENFKPLYNTPLFGFGSRSDYSVSRNLNIKSEGDAKSFEIKADREPIEKFKRLLIETIYYNRTGKKVPYDKIPNNQEIYEEFLTKKDSLNKKDEIKRVVDTTINYQKFEQHLSLIGDTTKTLDRDIYFKSKDLVKTVFKTDNTSFISEVCRIVNIILSKQLLKREKFNIESNETNEAQFEVIKYIYIVVSIHHIQHAFGIKVSDEPTQYFIKLLMDKAKSYIDKSGLSKKVIEQNYYNALVKVDNILNTSNMSLSVQETNKNEYSALEELNKFCTYIEGKEQPDHPLIKSIYNSINTSSFKEKRRMYKPSILSITRMFTSDDIHFDIKDLDKKVSQIDFKGFYLNRFYQYYTNGCPKATLHDWLNDKCKNCGLTKEMIENLDEKYYNIYKEDFNKHKPRLDIKIIKQNITTPINDLPDIKPEFLKGKIDEIISKYKLPNLKIPLLNLTRNEKIDLLINKTKLIESPINLDNVSKLKYYLSIYKINVNILNNKKSLDELFIAMFYKLIEKLDKKALEDLIEYDLSFAQRDINELLAKKKKTIGIDKYDFTYDEVEVEDLDEAEDGIDFEDDDADQNPEE